MAHVGEEFALGAVRLLCLIPELRLGIELAANDFGLLADSASEDDYPYKGGEADDR